jgi:hypothetical protein
MKINKEQIKDVIVAILLCIGTFMIFKQEKEIKKNNYEKEIKKTEIDSLVLKIKLLDKKMLQQDSLLKCQREKLKLKEVEINKRNNNRKVNLKKIKKKYHVKKSSIANINTEHKYNEFFANRYKNKYPKDTI